MSRYRKAAFADHPKSGPDVTDEDEAQWSKIVMFANSVHEVGH